MLHQLTDPEYLEHLLQRNGITPARSAGQNFLVCEEPLQAMVSGLEGGATAITELGAGVGPLTQALLESGYRVRALERDENLASILRRELGKNYSRHLDVVNDDLRKTTWEWESAWQLVGNIPYNLSGYIIRHLVALDPAPEQAIFMVQQEVGERLVASPPHGNLLGLAAQLWGSVHLLLSVPRTCFLPSPAVNSVVVVLIPHGDMRLLSEREHILAVASVFFQQKRKQMGGILKRSFGLSLEQVEKTLSALGVLATVRPQELSPAQWSALAHQLTPPTT